MGKHTHNRAFGRRKQIYQLNLEAVLAQVVPQWSFDLTSTHVSAPVPWDFKRGRIIRLRRNRRIVHLCKGGDPSSIICSKSDCSQLDFNLSFGPRGV